MTIRLPITAILEEVPPVVVPDWDTNENSSCCCCSHTVDATRPLCQWNADSGRTRNGGARRVHILLFGHVFLSDWVSLISRIADRLARRQRAERTLSDSALGSQGHHPSSGMNWTNSRFKSSTGPSRSTTSSGGQQPTQKFSSSAETPLHLRVTTVSFHAARFTVSPLVVLRHVTKSVLHAAAAAHGITVEIDEVEVRVTIRF